MNSYNGYINSNTTAEIGQQVQTTYENYKKIKSFHDVGFFLQYYVNEGGEVTKNIKYNNMVDVTDISVSLADQVMVREGISFETSIPNTVYYLDFHEDGDWKWGTSHPDRLYLPIAEVTTDGQGNVQTITDKALPRGGFRLKDEFGLEDYAKNVDVNQKMADMDSQIENTTKYSLNNNSGLSRSIYKMISGEPVKIVCYGDSITFGYQPGTGARVEMPYPLALQTRLREIYNNPNIVVVNNGRSGWKSDQALANIQTNIIDEDPDVAIIMFGINDVRHSVSVSLPNYRENISNMVRRCVENGIEPLVLSPTPINDTNRNNHIILTKYVIAAKEAAKRYGASFINMHIEIEKMYFQNAVDPYSFMGDSVHLAEDNYKYLADIVIRFVLEGDSVTRVLRTDGDMKYSVPLVYSPHVYHNLTNTFVSDMQDYKINYIMGAGSSGLYLKLNLFVTSPNMRLVLKHAKNTSGGQLGIRDNGIIVKTVDFYSPGSHVVNSETTLIERMSIGWHSILFNQQDLAKGQSIGVGNAYLSEIVIEPNTEKEDLPYVNSSEYTLPTVENFRPITQGGTIKSRGSVAGEQRGVLLFSGPSVELIENKKLIIEAEGMFSSSTGISWFGNRMSASSGTNVSGVNTGYLVFSTTTQLHLYYFENLNVLSTPIASVPNSLDYNIPHLLRVEHSDTGEIAVFIDDVEMIRVTDIKNKNGYFGLWTFGASKLNLSRYEYCYI